MAMNTMNLHKNYDQHIGENEVSGQKSICCTRINQKEMSERETCRLRIFYWAAFYGIKNIVRLMLVHCRWSPFIKSYRGRSVATASVIGQQAHVAQMLISEYEYRAQVMSRDQKKQAWLRKADKFKIFGKDLDDNNILHHTYIHNMPEVRQMLRDSYYIKPSAERNAQQELNMTRNREAQKKAEARERQEKKDNEWVTGYRMNRRGFKPSRLAHDLKAEHSVDESVDESHMQDDTLAEEEIMQADEAGPPTAENAEEEENEQQRRV